MIEIEILIAVISVSFIAGVVGVFSGVWYVQRKAQREVEGFSAELRKKVNDDRERSNGQRWAEKGKLN